MPFVIVRIDVVIRQWSASPVNHPPRAAVPGGRERLVDTFRSACLHPAMPLSQSLTRRRAVDLVRVAAALCRPTG
jgi:hypothetical protein